MIQGALVQRAFRNHGSRRNLWTATTARAFDSLGHAFEASVIALAHRKHELKPTLAVFCSSSNFKDLGRLRDHLVHHLPSVNRSIGLLTSPVLGESTFSLLLASGEDADTTRIIRSIVRGRKDKSVGRWMSSEDREVEKAEAVHESFHTSFENSFIDASETAKIDARYLIEGLEKDTTTWSPSAFLLLTDHQPQYLLNSIHHTFPSALTCGILGAFTPFVTGRPTTLLFNDKVQDHGAVGLAFPKVKTNRIRTTFPRMNTITGIHTVTNAKGNMIYTLDNRPATSILMNSLSNPLKVAEYYMAELDAKETRMRLHRITAGDPARGTMGLESSTNGINIGSKVQILQTLDSSSLPLTLSNSLIEFRCEEILSSNSRVSERSVLNKFVVASENGFVSYQSSPWVCNVPGSSIKWNLQ